MIPALALLLSCQLAGELVSRAAALPVPGPVLGMALLFLLLLWRRKAWDPLEQAADTLLRHLSLLFVPAGVGVVQHWPLIQAQLLPLAAVLVASTLLALLAGAGAFVLVHRLLERQR